jgi:molybdopterin/thiamine biosynthesis adenylyltransferase
MRPFDHDTAFPSNIGCSTWAELDRLRNARIAIGGLGEVGGAHFLTLARLGIGKFSIADFDTRDQVNFNRQAGANMSTLDKLNAMAEQALSINPELDIRVFPEGVSQQNLDDFMDGVDIYIDGLDFFAFDAREQVFSYCARHEIPAVTVAPLGKSAALLNFMPGGMSFEDYFQVSGRPEPEKAVRFLVGLAPALLHRQYLADKTRVNLKEHLGLSTAMACQLCAGAAASEALKILLKRGNVRAAPHAIQFDGYRNRMAHTWRPGGNGHLLNRLAIAFAKLQLGI